VELLKQLIVDKPARQTKWDAKCVEENDRLLEEATTSSDILFVDVIDVYRNIPVKFIHFAQWSFSVLFLCTGMYRAVFKPPLAICISLTCIKLTSFQLNGNVSMRCYILKIPTSS
jgi:hypothetical protein